MESIGWNPIKPSASVEVVLLMEAAQGGATHICHRTEVQWRLETQAHRELAITHRSAKATTDSKVKRAQS